MLGSVSKLSLRVARATRFIVTWWGNIIGKKLPLYTTLPT